MNTKNVQKYKESRKGKNKNLSSSKIILPVKRVIAGIGISNDIKENVLELIVKNIKNSTENWYIVTPNPEMIVMSRKNSDFRDALSNANLALNDGVGLLWASRVLGVPLKERITGLEIMENLCEKVSNWPITVGFLGAGPKIAERVAERLKATYQNLKIVYISQELDEQEKMPAVDVLFIAFGAPKQEIWMQRHINKIPVRVMMGIGGAFDQIVDPSLRPPQFLQAIGLGWLYRLIRQPWRIKRQIALLEFVWIILKEKLSK